MSSQAIGDTLVTIKVNHNGRMCRFKLPLRDMTAATLEDKVRSIALSSPPSSYRLYTDAAAPIAQDLFVVADWSFSP